MAELQTEPKGRLALDMNWMAAACGVIAFGFCLIATLLMAWRLLTGAPVVEVRISWQTVLVALFGVWFMIEVRERTARFLIGLLVLASGSRLMLAALRASAQTQFLNAQIVRVIDLVVMTGLCAYIAYWFKQRIKRV